MHSESAPVVPKALITGCGGFIGSHLADFLLEKGIEVTGTVHKNMKNVDHLKNKIKIVKCDIGKREEVEKLFDSDYNYVFHLAAQSFVMPSWDNPEETLHTNIMGTEYLLNALHKKKSNAVVLVACSSAEYGLTHADEIPIKETKELRPSSPYAVSKIGQDMLSYLYYQAFGMKIVRIRFFNTVGPRKTNNACADFAKGIAEIEAGIATELKVGNLNSIVDLTDIRDALNAIWVLANAKKYGETFNICSGKAVKVSDILEKFVSLSSKDIKIVTDSKKIRPLDDAVFLGDNSKLHDLGWKTKVSLDEALSDIMKYWREEVRK